mgnify:CR=1 FL=1
MSSVYLPKDIIRLIMTYVYSLEHYNKMKHVLRELEIKFIVKKMVDDIIRDVLSFLHL